MTMVSVSEPNLFNDSSCMGIYDIVDDRLPHSPLRRWTDYSTMMDRQEVFSLHYFFIPITESKHKAAVQGLTYWCARPDDSDYVPA